MLSKESKDISIGHLGQTSGSDEREPEKLQDMMLTFNLEEELAKLKREKTWLEGEKNARTLSKRPDQRVVLVSIKAGGKMEEHSRNSSISIQMITGEILFRSAGQELNLTQGSLLTLEASVPHEAEALEESAFLLTIGPDSR